MKFKLKPFKEINWQFSSKFLVFYSTLQSCKWIKIPRATYLRNVPPSTSEGALSWRWLLPFLKKSKAPKRKNPRILRFLNKTLWFKFFQFPFIGIAMQMFIILPFTKSKLSSLFIYKSLSKSSLSASLVKASESEKSNSSRRFCLQHGCWYSSESLQCSYSSLWCSMSISEGNIVSHAPHLKR